MTDSVTLGTQATTRSPTPTPSALIAAAVAATLIRSSDQVISDRVPSSKIETMATDFSSPFDKRFSATFNRASTKNSDEMKFEPGE